MKRIDYDEKESANTATHIATDVVMDRKYNDRNAFEEGFAAESGIRGVTAASGGTVRQPEQSDNPHPKRIPDALENGNPGIADD